MAHDNLEIILQEAIPSIRAAIAKNLLSMGLTQKETAEKLGLTQPAVSQYSKNSRGKRSGLLTNNPMAMKAIKDLSKRLSSGQPLPREVNIEILNICRDLV